MGYPPARPANEGLGPDGLKKLKAAKVSDAVIQALRDTNRRAKLGYFESAGNVAGNQYPQDATRLAGILSSDDLVGFIMGGGNVAVNSFVQNDSVGRILVTNNAGVINFNAINGLANEGTISVENGGTFQSDSSNSWSNAGIVDMRGGTLRTGGTNAAAVSAVFTNKSTGLINGYGTLVGGGGGS